MVKTASLARPLSIVVSLHLRLAKNLVMSTWLNFAFVAIGGAIGSVCRYAITCLATTIPGGSTLWGTAVANILGCAAIGALGEYCLVDEAISERLKIAIRVGFLGGLTTFSTFAFESAALAGTNRWGGAGIYVAANLFIGWAALLAGAAIVKGWTT
jgi:CrcB protein